MDVQGKDIKTPTKKNKKTSVPHTPQTPDVDSSVKRRVSGILVTFHKCIQSWETDNQASFNTANTLCNLYSQWNMLKDSNGLPEVSELCKRKYNVKLIATREDLIKQLKEHQQRLQVLIKKMRGLLDNLKAIYFLGLVSDNDMISFNGETSCSEFIEASQPVIFNSWTADQFYRTMKIILNMYAKEYIMKETFYEKFFNFRVEDMNASEEGTSALSQCANIWLHQPFIVSNGKYLLDSMLVEAELK